MYHVLVGISTAEKDVIHRSLHVTYPDYFVKEHYHVLLTIDMRRGRDTSVPTEHALATPIIMHQNLLAGNMVIFFVSAYTRTIRPFLLRKRQ